MNALASGRSAAGVKSPPPGRTISSTPMKPPASATQVRRSTRSPSTGPASAAMMIGVMKAIAAASASGISLSALRKTRLDAASTTPRMSCRRRFVVRSSAPPMRGPSTSAISTMCTT